MALDTVRDRVLLAVTDCFQWDTKSGGARDDCHFDVWAFPRLGGPNTAIESFEVPMPIANLELPSFLDAPPFEVEFDDRNDLILTHVQGEDVGIGARLRFFRPDSSEVLGLARLLTGGGATVSNRRYCD
jgi:hypothetical protein